MKKLETDVVIIGGGATGAGVMRDCAMRGIKCILLEQYDIASGATGRNHGLLHSGARYAVTDQHSAAECIKENMILKQVARHCIEPTNGLFITLPEDDLAYVDNFVSACTSAGIQAERMDPAQALQMEPSANPLLTAAVKVPDGTVDPFRLAASNMLDGIERGGQIFNHTRVESLIREQGRINGVIARDLRNGELVEIRCQYVVNAAGIWGQGISEYADLRVRMFPAKGALLILEHRMNNMVINRCRKPADADILVPGDTVSVIGTTSTRIPYDQIEHLSCTPEEVDLLMAEGSKLCPSMEHARVLRAYAGVRPLVSLGDDDSGRNITRGIVLLDHHERDGLDGFVTITGGKLMTYRLMAERTTDLLAKKLGNSEPCRTAEIALPGSDVETTATTLASKTSRSVSGSAIYRHGTRGKKILEDKNTDQDSALICECEMVTRGEIEYAIRELKVDNMVDLRRRTRLGMGPCQGEMCAYRAAGLFNEFGAASEMESVQLLADFLEERWKGCKPVLWNDTLREAEYAYWVYQGLFGLGDIADQDREILL
ncbi:anaerobic glycerol-3-phosphate dehydrogenase subunit A [Pelagibaculum spongiae]|uniref:glycerol-3-phosphate dehydrogenase n=1 Tax=Pelagibaculum spongiae TaxID=2080658 RepID=A0A2V1H1U0_9GAMM|nr:anaerobic glycerol-3-phosphate dehydrogenase subunit A [Pelagibaculum spongiae]PVZ69650.1 anaerobic glycerol-3-phosphate dehydrogenase subunit A [Pelagibaculum spongiae]